MDVGFAGISMFAAILLLTLAITYFSARAVSGVSDFYSAGGKIPGPLNGLAISGDFLSATTLLGITGLFFATGVDAAIYLICPMIGMLIMLAVLAGPIRKHGKYTLADILAARFVEKPMRILSAVNTLVISIFYLVVQMVGAGALIEIIFGIPYALAVVMVGLLMTMYVSFGGMVATTWVQITKAALLILGILSLSLSSLGYFGFDIGAMSSVAVKEASATLFSPGPVTSNAFSSMSLSMGLVLDMCGLPHVLIRLFTVPNERAARVSVVVAMWIIAFAFVSILLVIGPSAIAILNSQEGIFDPSGAVIGGGNMIVLHLSRVVGGEFLLGFIAAVVFATILAVVAGLTIASVGALSHDLIAQVFSGKQSEEYDELRASRVMGVVVGVVAIGLGIAFEGQNLAYLVGLVFAIAASANFPILLMALHVKKATTRSILAVGTVGLVSSVGLVIAGPTVWVDIFGFQEALINIRYPAFISVACSGATALLSMAIVKK